MQLAIYQTTKHVTFFPYTTVRSIMVVGQSWQAVCLVTPYLKNTTDSDAKMATVMNSKQVSKILLIQALEQSDPQGRYISHSTRQRATQHARKGSPHEPPSSAESSIQFFTNRAESLWNFLSTSYPMITESFRGAQATIPYTIVAIPAFAAGLFINGLGTTQRVNLLNFPLLILLLWNMGTYAGTILPPLLGKDLTGPLLRHLAKGFAAVTEWLGKGPWPKMCFTRRCGQRMDSSIFRTIYEPVVEALASRHYQSRSSSAAYWISLSGTRHHP